MITLLITSQQTIQPFYAHVEKFIMQGRKIDLFVENLKYLSTVYKK